MRNLNSDNLLQITDVEATDSWSAVSSGPLSSTYHELADRPVVQMDVIEQIEMNLLMLEDLQGRLSFLNREVRTILKA